MNGFRRPRRPNPAQVSFFRRRRKWHGWLRPLGLRWGLVVLLTAATFTAAASASLFTITHNVVAHTTHVVQHLLHDEKSTGALGATHHTTPAEAQYAPQQKPKPNITITEDPAKQTVDYGANATFDIKVTNTGTVTLHGVLVDPPVSDCDRTIGILAPKDGLEYTCTLVGVTKTLVNTATAVGFTPAGTKVTDKASARVNVKGTPKTKTKTKTTAPLKPPPPVTPPPPPPPPPAPSLTVAKLPHVQTVTTKVLHLHTKTGTTTTVMYGYAWFTITVKNTGHTPLVNLTVRNAQSPGCDRHITRLAPGAAHTYRCFTIAVRDEPANLAIAYGKAPKGKSVTATASAAVIVHIKTVNTGGVHFAG